MNTRPILRKGLMLALGAISAMATLPAAIASNHCDAPLIKQDRQSTARDPLATPLAHLTLIPGRLRS